ncbi:LytR/AlgR family response regulator transcription factor [Pedobacter sp. UBA5917]|jgi:two-component system LytT family response regulator|uniref:LytR/AlgR family response regulator transcription factor n=1 Tax=Pedobacter sp. UBA5917 TaxID=1947061 RepID=UPI0025D18D6C|nr:response regulator [Pedobacter sp. UBA5917]
MLPFNTAQLKCVIIDDDQLSIDILNNFIARTGELTTIATYTDPIDGILAIREIDDVDFLFLDIGMEVSGLDVAKVIREHVRYLIFVTGHEKYALDAFGVYCDKFIVKPITYEKINSAVTDIIKKENR